MDSCIVLGANSSYSVSEDDHVALEHEDEPSPDISGNYQVTENQNVENGEPPEYIIELQVMFSCFFPLFIFILHWRLLELWFNFLCKQRGEQMTTMQFFYHGISGTKFLVITN